MLLPWVHVEYQNFQETISLANISIQETLLMVLDAPYKVLVRNYCHQQ